MNAEQLVGVLTNAAMAGLAFAWVFICLAYWTRRKRPLHITGATFSALLCVIFILRAFVTAESKLIPMEAGQSVIRWLWLAGVITWLIYSIVFLLERATFRVVAGKTNDDPIQ